MISRLRTHKGQAVVPEKVIIFFVVMGAMVAMGTFVQRSLQARARDARNYAMDQAAQGCTAAGAGCVAAVGGVVSNGTFIKEYEPYYSMSSADVDRQRDENKGMVGGNFVKTWSEVTTVTSQSNQLPPVDANRDGL